MHAAKGASAQADDHRRIGEIVGARAKAQQIAAAVALRALGRKVVVTDTGALVAQVIPGTPAVGKLEPDNVITAVGPTPIRGTAEVCHAMA